jgi:chorismate dehydratase
MIRLSDIQFINSWPVTYALREGIVPADVKSVSGTPAQLNRRLLMGELDAGAVSSMMYLKHHEEFVPVPGLCIRADSAVASVLVVSRRPLKYLEGVTLGMSNQGATTPVLLRLLLKQKRIRCSLEVSTLRFPEILEAYPAALLIGDEALQAVHSKEALYTWDLGQGWADWTHQPCVFALWVIRRKLAQQDPEIVDRLQAALQVSYAWGQLHEDRLIEAMRRVFPWERPFLKNYLSKLSYDFDAKAWAGLRRLALESERSGVLAKGTTQELEARRWMLEIGSWKSEEEKIFRASGLQLLTSER